MYVCMLYGNFGKPWRRKFVFDMRGHLHGIGSSFNCRWHGITAVTRRPVSSGTVCLVKRCHSHPSAIYLTLRSHYFYVFLMLWHSVGLFIYLCIINIEHGVHDGQERKQHNETRQTKNIARKSVLYSDLGLLPMTLTTFSALPTYMRNICAHVSLWDSISYLGNSTKLHCITPVTVILATDTVHSVHQTVDC